MTTSTNTSPVAVPLTELRDHIAEFTARCRGARWLGALFHVRVMAAIVADLSGWLHGIGRRVCQGEQCSREALRMIEQAQAPDSPGGRNITPEESVPIRRMVVRAADLAADASTKLTTASCP